MSDGGRGCSALGRPGADGLGLRSDVDEVGTCTDAGFGAGAADG
jgi:hypothetical protein